MNKAQVYHLGESDYKTTWEFQEKLLKDNVNLKINHRKGIHTDIATQHHIVFCTHPKVITLGKSGDLTNLLLDEKTLQEKGIEFYKINRGGDITYHGPGQLVVYPILDLEKIFTDIHKYLRYLEIVVINTLAEFGIESGLYEGFTGVWIDPKGQNPRKICAMGVRCSRWVTMHGLALNVNTNLDDFSSIVPCGIDDKKVTSMQQELGKAVSIEEVMRIFKLKFSNQFDLKLNETGY